MYYAQHVPRVLCLPCTHPGLGDAGLKSPLSRLHAGIALDLAEPTPPHGDLCPGLLRLSADADGAVCGVPLVRAATLDLAFFLAQHGSYCHHRGGGPPQKGLLPAADLAGSNRHRQLCELSTRDSHSVCLSAALRRHSRMDALPSAADHGLPICVHPRTHPVGRRRQRALPRYSAYPGSPPDILVFPLSHRVQEHTDPRAISHCLVT